MKCAVLAISSRVISTDYVVYHLNSFLNKSANSFKMAAASAIGRKFV